MGEFRMPTLGADMTEGTLLEWLVKPGDTVHHGQVVAVIDTVKTAIDVEVFEDGEVERLLVEPGTTVQVGTPLALLRGAGAPIETTADLSAGPAPRPLRKGRTGISSGNGGPNPPVETTPDLSAGSAPRPLRKERTGISSRNEGPTPPVGSPAQPLAVAPAPPASPIVRHLAHERGVDLAAVVGHGPDGAVTRADVEAAATPAPPPETRAPERARRPASAPRTSGGRVAASPLARTRASELGVDLATLVGTGPHGAVTVADVESAATAAPTVAPEPVSAAVSPARPDATAAEERRAAMQAATGALMARSKREIPHYYLETTIDLAAAMAWLARHNEGRPSTERVLPSALLLLATARSLRQVPELNGFYTEKGFEPREHVDLGVAVSMRRGGLVVASVHDADTMTVDEFMAALKGVAERTRAGRLRGSELAVPTITVTNLGDQGADLVHGVIYPPQVALVGFGRIVPRPWAVDGMLAVRPVVVATLAADHRVSDGHRGSRFLAALDAALQRPEEL